MKYFNTEKIKERFKSAKNWFANTFEGFFDSSHTWTVIAISIFILVVCLMIKFPTFAALLGLLAGFVAVCSVIYFLFYNVVQLFRS